MNVHKESDWQWLGLLNNLLKVCSTQSTQQFHTTTQWRESLGLPLPQTAPWRFLCPPVEPGFSASGNYPYPPLPNLRVRPYKRPGCVCGGNPNPQVCWRIRTRHWAPGAASRRTRTSSSICLSRSSCGLHHHDGHLVGR